MGSRAYGFGYLFGTNEMMRLLPGYGPDRSTLAFPNSRSKFFTYKTGTGKLQNALHLSLPSSSSLSVSTLNDRAFDFRFEPDLPFSVCILRVINFPEGGWEVEWVRGMIGR